MSSRAAPPRSLAAALALACCKANAPAGESPPVSAPAEAPVEPEARPDLAAPRPAAEPAPNFTSGPLDYAASATGVLVVWSRHDGEASEIVAQRLDPRGRPLGAPRLVLRTEGEIVDLALGTANGGTWIAHVAALGSEPPSGQLGVVALTDDLSVTSARVLDRFTAEALLAWDSSRVRALALGPDTAVVASLGAPVPCRDRVVGGTRPCPGYHLFAIRSDGFERVGQVGVDGGQSSMGALVDLGAGILVDVWAWHGGPSHADLYLPRGAAATSTPKFRRVPCRPPIRRGFDGEALVSWCAGDDAGIDELCRLSDDDATAACARVHRVTLADRLLTPRKEPLGPPLTARSPRCSGGRPVLDLAWQGGSLRLDPQAPGADLDLRPELGVWTGEYGLQIAGGGQISRLRCEPDDRLTRDPEPAAPLDLLAPATAD
ncbi:hypothetical protein [Nannocystis punicea]|uniref:Uncharacterized protein n=1 Tax=Nannocystis punicea TaxID=2995304 RepID=A0ABY7H3B6_9BACT|nr:hypothetical protein [Nannocystis poenicansa]WAS93697.1 hypothetical protein O0S08_46790 [Nannocystis poenicansa]